jgi:hypothetical protein
VIITRHAVGEHGVPDEAGAGPQGGEFLPGVEEPLLLLPRPALHRLVHTIPRGSVR